MNNCRFCGGQLDENASFCPHCMNKLNSVRTVAISELPNRNRTMVLLLTCLCIGGLLIGGLMFFLLQPTKNTTGALENGTIAENSALENRPNFEADNNEMELSVIVKKWSGYYGMDRLLTLDIFDIDRNYKIKGLLTLSHNDKGVTHQQSFEISPDGEGNYYMIISADNEYELWFNFLSESQISCSWFDSGGGATYFDLT